jgi:sulfate transport system substrate-binding protein
MKKPGVLVLAAMLSLLSVSSALAGEITLLNVSYDPTRELYQQFNAAFVAHWKATTGDTVSIKQSHGGSGKQSRSVIDGLEADVVTLGISYDIDSIAERARLLPPDWQKRLPDNSSPYTSTIVLLARAGNPKGIKDWGDLVRPGVKVVTPNPKTSSGGRWNYVAAYGYALKKANGNEAVAIDFVTTIYKRVEALDTGARASTVRFTQHGDGDVLIAWENEAILALNEAGGKGFEIVYPSVSVLAEPPVAWVDRVTSRHKTEAVAKAYLEYLYSDEGQEIVARNHYRPRNPKIAEKHAAEFPKISLFTVDGLLGGWKAVHEKHFKESGVFDQVYKP